MQTYILLSVIILILSATTALENACARMRIRNMLPVLCALIMLCLSGMNHAPLPEVELNFAAILMPLALLVACNESSKLTLLQGAGTLAMSAAGCVLMILFEDAGLSVVAGLMAGMAAACMADSADALLIGSSVPLISSVLYWAYEYAVSGYAACILGGAALMNAQMAAIVSVLVAYALPQTQKGDVIP